MHCTLVLQHLCRRLLAVHCQYHAAEILGLPNADDSPNQMGQEKQEPWVGAEEKQEILFDWANQTVDNGKSHCCL